MSRHMICTSERTSPACGMKHHGGASPGGFGQSLYTCVANQWVRDVGVLTG